MKKEGLMLRFLYHTIIGRIFLRVLYNPLISVFMGHLLSTRISCLLIPRFIKKNKIKMVEYESVKYSSFNDFFTRKIREYARVINKDKKSFVSPSDGYLSAYKIKDGLVLPVKESHYSISSLLKNEDLASKYQDGVCLVIRLCVENYHRYCYLDNGKKEKNVFISGVLHTVRPIALVEYPVFVENSREYTVLHTNNFGDVIEVEVGALLVGKIKNYHEKHTFKKGEEKGCFLFGGSTIILLIEKDKVKIFDKYFDATKKGKEVPVLMGEVIGKK